jgi:trans-aconitate 2-methyltransferase
MTVWNPATYLEFADERSRPFFDLTSRILSAAPRSVVDLGCGPGQLTAALASRWPEARTIGIDSSPEMIEQTKRYAGPAISFQVMDLLQWRPLDPVDVLVSNATLQWVPRHREVLPQLVDFVAPGGWLAFQVPGNFTEPSHSLLHDIAADVRYASYTADVEAPMAFDAETYLGDLVGLGCSVDAWESTYLHVLNGPDPVFRWIRGTGARPVLQALPDELRAEFEQEYKAALVAAYPTHSFGTVLPFRRVFVVAQIPG